MNSYLFKLLTFAETSVCSPSPTPQSGKQPAQLEELHECTSPLHWRIVVESWPASMHALLWIRCVVYWHTLPSILLTWLLHVPAMSSVLWFPGKWVVLIPSMSHTHEHPARKTVRTYILSAHNFICNASVSEGLLQAYNAYKTDTKSQICEADGLHILMVTEIHSRLLTRWYDLKQHSSISDSGTATSVA